MTYSPELISYVEVKVSLSAHKNREPVAHSRLYQGGPLAFDTTKTKALGTCNLVPGGWHMEKVK